MPKGKAKIVRRVLPRAKAMPEPDVAPAMLPSSAPPPVMGMKRGGKMTKKGKK